MTITRKMIKAPILRALLVAGLLSASSLAKAQDPAASYPKMAPIDQYLMADRNAEIAMARNTYGGDIRRCRSVGIWKAWLRNRDQRQERFHMPSTTTWMSPFSTFRGSGIPKMRGPICFNPPAARSIMPLTFKRTELVLAGLSKAQIIEGIKAFDAKELPALEPGAMCYMMSIQGYLNDSAGHWFPHLMFYIPLTES